MAGQKASQVSRHIDGDGLFAGAIGALPHSVLRDPVRLPVALSDVLRRLDDTRVTSSDVCRSIGTHAGASLSSFAKALVEIGEAADASGVRNAYHNPAHSRDVGVVFLNLLRLEALHPRAAEDLSAQDMMIGCCAAFGHDVGHDGISDSRGQAFRLEALAADIVGDIMRRHAIEPLYVERAQCAILTTEVQQGYGILEAARRGEKITTSGSNIPSSLRAITDSATRRLAFLLRDSDVMQSAGLSPADHDRQTRRLEAEQGVPRNTLGAQGADFFLRDMIRGHFLSSAGRVFQPQLDQLLHLNDLRAASQADRPSSLADMASREHH
jgi:hypothetical protein